MTSNTIPQIDCSAIGGDVESVFAEDLNAVAQEFGAVMTGIGMCYLINHGLDMKKVNISSLFNLWTLCYPIVAIAQLMQVETIYEVSNNFFMLPMETKLKYRKKTKSNHGYGCPGDQKYVDQL